MYALLPFTSLSALLSPNTRKKRGRNERATKRCKEEAKSEGGEENRRGRIGKDEEIR
jgi:hypothetical protein